MFSFYNFHLRKVIQTQIFQNLKKKLVNEIQRELISQIISWCNKKTLLEFCSLLSLFELLLTKNSSIFHVCANSSVPYYIKWTWHKWVPGRNNRLFMRITTAQWKSIWFKDCPSKRIWKRVLEGFLFPKRLFVL